MPGARGDLPRGDAPSVEIGDLGMAAGDLQIDARHGGGQQTFKPPGAVLPGPVFHRQERVSFA